MLLLSRFKGVPQFEWVNEVLPKIDQLEVLNKCINEQKNIFPHAPIYERKK